MTDERPRSFAAALRNNLRPVDWLAYAAVAFVLRFFLNLSLTATAVITGITIPVSVMVFSAGQYALYRFASRAGDDPGGSDGS